MISLSWYFDCLNIQHKPWPIQHKNVTYISTAGIQSLNSVEISVVKLTSFNIYLGYLLALLGQNQINEKEKKSGN